MAKQNACSGALSPALPSLFPPRHYAFDLAASAAFLAAGWLNLIGGSLATSPVSGWATALLPGWLRQFLRPGKGASATGPV